jgi:hypothetical protein
MKEGKQKMKTKELTVSEIEKIEADYREFEGQSEDIYLQKSRIKEIYQNTEENER